MIDALKKKAMAFSKESGIRFLQDEVRRNISVIRAYLRSKQAAVREMAGSEDIFGFLASCGNDTYTVEHPQFKSMINKLKYIKANEKDVYLSYIGICSNEDAIDNNGRSRQQECKAGIRDCYLLTKRDWYMEMKKSAVQPVILSPVRDTSGSYVISIVQEIFNKKKAAIGVVGIDVTVQAIVRNISLDYPYIITAGTGEIVYDSESKLKGVMEKRYNIILALGPGIIECLRTNKMGTFLVKKRWRRDFFIYAPIIPDKYYIIVENK